MKVVGSLQIVTPHSASSKLKGQRPCLGGVNVSALKYTVCTLKLFSERDIASIHKTREYF